MLQEFCLRVLARKDQLRDTERLDAWLYAVLRSALNDHDRKAGRSRRLNDAIALEAKSADGDLIRRLGIEETDRAAAALRILLQAWP